MKVYRLHYCHRNHRNYRTLARCLWPRAEWIAGDGPYATLARCRVLTVELHTTEDTARKSLARIDGTGCGGRCYGDHELIVLLPQGGAA
jgi:hypothetical protein